MAKAAVLVVENEAIVAAHLASEIDTLGYRVMGPARSGEEALLLAQAERPDLVLTDIRLPGSLDGVETAQRLRDQYDIPVIFITGHSDKDTVKRASLAGSFGYVLKPWDTRDLATQLEIILYRHQSEQALRASEAQLRLITDTAPVFIAHIDTQGRYKFVNKAYAERLGLQAEDCIGKRIEQVVGAKAYATFHRYVEATLGGQRIDFEVEIPYDRIGLRYMHCSYVPEMDSRGSVHGLVAVITDVTERKQAERAAQQLQAVSTALIQSRDVVTVYERILDAAVAIMQSQFASIQMFDESRGELQLLGCRGFTSEAVKFWKWVRPETHSACAVAMRTGRRVVISDVTQCDVMAGTNDLATCLQTGIRAIQTTPLLSRHGTLIGMISTQWDQVHEPSDANLGQMDILARLAADLIERKQAEDRLRESEERLRAMFGQASVGIALIDGAGHFLEVNERLCAIVGRPREAVLLLTCKDLTHPDDWPCSVTLFTEVLDRQRPSFETEKRYGRPDGSWVWVQLSVSPILNGEGQTERLVAVVSDITDRKQAEDALRESDARFSGFMAHLPGLAWIKDDAGRYMFTNEAALDAFGKSRQELYGKTDDELFAPMTAQQFKQNDRMVLSSGSAMEIIEELEHADGHHYSLVNKFPIPSASGTMIGGIALDVTEHRKAEEALRRSEALYRAIGESIDYGVWVCTPDGRNTYASASFLKLLGITQAQCSNFGWGDALHPDEAADTMAAWEECARTGGTWDKEHRFRGIDGEWHHVLARGVPVKDEQGRILCWAGINLDISRLKRSEEQLRQSEARLEARVAARTHALVQSQEQLRALANDLNVTEQRERKRLAVELHDHLAQMLVLASLKLAQGKKAAGHSSTELVEQAERIIRESLSYTRTLVAELSPPVLRDHGLASGLKWLGEHMKKYDMTVVVTAPDEDAFRIPEEQAEPLFQSVRELLINSRKHSGLSHASVTMERQGDWLRIEVADQGKGFDLTAVTGGSSSKFGLFSIRERMKAIGGSLRIESRLGQGTKCLLELPLSTVVTPDSATTPASVDRSAGTSSSIPQSTGLIRVLLVDDHAMMRQGLRTLLQGYTDIEIIGECSNGKEAVEAVRKVLPTVVIMDINMPVMNGIEATAHITAQHPRTIVIGLSVNADYQNEAAMKEAGAAILITKEAAVDQLYSAIIKIAASPDVSGK